ncbi:MAG: hypothetical protein WB625_15460 [Candidatus Sulfotelmatobacter sp.]|jgi:hypothetical protein
MTQKCFWCGTLIVVLSVGLAMPARAANPETVLIVIAATTAAAAIAAVVTVASVQHRRHKIVITGCVISGEKGMTVTDEEDSKIYVLSGNTTGIKPGDRMRLQKGKKVKGKGPDKTRVWEAKEVVEDFGVCRR